ncbi:autophagy-related protein 13a-like [Chenopodium quinoa]|uniref:autophagy-related protein 13a-like n=1 Tax=Chenopodium quinoa TaxID=63459 RepID=UPI000B78C0F1|nr:autophagy-related protein 13a-like [Chenopodium quinoa]
MDFQVSSSSEHGRLEQIISQFLLKALQVILESRIPSLKTQDHSGDLLSNSKPKKTDKWFNLALGDRPAALEKLQSWHRNLMDPMVIDVIVISRGLDGSSGNDYNYEQVFEEGAVETVIERWVVQYENHKTMPVQTRDVTSLYKKMYQKSIILFRSLCSMMRHLPAYRIFRNLSSSSQPSDIDVIYKVSSFSDPFSREEEQMMKQYSFNPVEAVNGRLSVSVNYRSDLSEFSLETSTSFPPVIISDYVGSPAIDPMRAFPSVEKVSNPISFNLKGARNACPMPSQRPHSWSSGIHSNAVPIQTNPLSGSPPAHRFSNDDPSLPTYMQGQRVQNYRMLGGHHKTNSYDESLSPPFSPSSSPSPPAYLFRYSPTQSRLRPESAPVTIPHPMLNRSPAYLSPNLSDPSRMNLPPFSPRSTKPEPSPHGSPSPSGNRLSKKLDALQPGELYSGTGNLSFGSKLTRDSKDESGRFSGLYSSSSSPRKAYSRSSSKSFQDELGVYDFSLPFDVDDVDTSDSQASQSIEPKKGSEFNSALSFGRKSQDAAVGALVHMLRTAPPLRQDSSSYSASSQSTQQGGSFGTASGFFMARDALEELKSYREMKDLLLSKSGNRVVSREDLQAPPLDIKGRKL